MLMKVTLKTKQYTALFKICEEELLKGDEEKAEWLCEDIHGTCQFVLICRPF